MKMKIRSIILILLETLSSFSVESTLVSKYSRTPRVTKGSCKKANFVMEKFTYGVCKHGGLDLFLYDITAGQCIQECRARTMCKSINMFLRVNWCRINFEENLVLNTKCPHYHYSSKADWIQKSAVGCESLNCSIKQKCMEKDGKYACVITECMNIPHLENGMVFGNDVKPGLTQAFMCNQGYEIKGDYVVTCQADGTWSPNIPTCIEKKKAAVTPSIDEESTSSSSKSADVTASSSKSADVTASSSKSADVTASSSKSADVTTTSSFTPSTTTATSNTLETTATSTTTAAPTTTSLTTTKPTSQASSSGTTTVSSTTSTVTVMTQTQSTTDAATTEGVSREASTSEVPCDENELVLSTNICNGSYDRCQFPQVYDPGTDECVNYCPKLLGTTFQVHQDQSIDTRSFAFIDSVDTFNYSICFEDCLRDSACTTIVIQSSVKNGATTYNCFFYRYAQYETAGLAEIKMIEEWVLLRNCDSNHQPKGLFDSPMVCRVGEMYSYSTDTCHQRMLRPRLNEPRSGKNCKQTESTFQVLVNIGIDDAVGGIHLLNVRQNVPSSYACLTECSGEPSCALLEVRKSGANFDCDAYGQALTYPLLLTNSEGRTVYLRDCD